MAISVYYIQKLSLCGNLFIWLVYKHNFPHEKVVFQILWIIIR